MPDVIQPPGWPRPSGFAHGMVASGRLLAVAGQIGMPPGGAMAVGFAAQVQHALDNLLAVVAAAGGKPTDVIALTVFVTNRYKTDDLREIWRLRFGDHYPTMTVVQVQGLVDPEALVEVQGLAVLP